MDCDDSGRRATLAAGVPAGGNRYTLTEEIANSVTHGIGAGLSIAALSILVTFAGLFGDAWRVVSFSIYGATLILLYLASTFYHSFQSPRLKEIFRVLDHSAIFLLIAGTYTPFTLVNLRGVWGWTLFGLIWGLAIFGILLEVFFMDRFKALTMATYVGMGWLVIIAFKPLLSAVPVGGMIWLGDRGTHVHARRDLLPLGQDALQPRDLALVRPGRQCLPFLLHAVLRPAGEQRIRRQSRVT